MKITKTEQGLAVVIPNDVAVALGWREGDDVTARSTQEGRLELSRLDDWEDDAAEIKRLARPFPPDYRFNREEANSR